MADPLRQYLVFFKLNWGFLAFGILVHPLERWMTAGKRFVDVAALNTEGRQTIGLHFRANFFRPN